MTTFLPPEQATITVIWPVIDLIPDPPQLARHGDPETIRLRGVDMEANGQLQAVGATEDKRLIYGHGRYLSALAVGIPTLEVKVYPATLSHTRFALIRAAENLHRNDLTGFQRWELCRDLMCSNPSWQAKDLAANLNITPPDVTKWLSPSRCIEAVQEALRTEQVSLSDVYEMAKVPQAKQAELLRAKLEGASRDVVARKSREMRAKPVEHAVKLARVRCPLSTGTTVEVRGAEMTLDGLIEALSLALDAAKRAVKDRLNVQTAMKVWADKARAAG